MEKLSKKPYLKPGGFSEPVLALKNLVKPAKTAVLQPNLSTIRSKSSRNSAFSRETAKIPEETPIYAVNPQYTRFFEENTRFRTQRGEKPAKIANFSVDSRKNASFVRKTQEDAVFLKENEELKGNL